MAPVGSTGLVVSVGLMTGSWPAQLGPVGEQPSHRGKLTQKARTPTLWWRGAGGVVVRAPDRREDPEERAVHHVSIGPPGPDSGSGEPTNPAVDPTSMSGCPDSSRSSALIAVRSLYENVGRAGPTRPTATPP